jgi:hypothetical protein
MASLLVMFQYGASGDFLGASAVAAGYLCTLFDMLVHSLFLVANSAQVLFVWHDYSPPVCASH